MARVINSEPKSRLSWRVVNASRDEAEIDIFDVIGENFWGEGVSAKSFIQDLRALGDIKSLRVNINTPGGIVDDALAIYDALLSHPADVTAHIVVAKSAGSFIAQAADHREITKNGQFFIHDAQGMGMGDASTMRQLADILDEESDNIADIYADRAGGTRAEWRARMQADGFGTTYRGQEAVDAGLADEVATTSKNLEPQRIAAFDPPSEEPVAPDLAALLAGERIAEHVGYKPPIPALEGLLTKHPVKFAGAAR